MVKTIIKSIVIIVIAVSMYYVGFGSGYNQIPQQAEIIPEGVDTSLLWDIWETLQNKFSGELDYQEMIYGAARGMVKSLDDPYTSYFNSDESEIFMSDINGSFEGVGMEIGIRDDYLTVIAPLEGTPAFKAGLLPGDKVIKIDEEFAGDISIDAAVKLIRGERGTPVVLTVVREGWTEAKEIEIIRGLILIPNIKYEVKEDNIGYIKVYQFSQNTNSDFSNLVNEISKNNDKLILDLRGNPGGLLGQAQLMAGWFIKKGDIVTIEDFNGESEEVYKAMGSEAFIDYPIVVLVNQGSASSAEILAAALRDNRDDVQLVGETTFGKGSVQEPVNLRGGSLLKVTVAHWLTPNRDLIHDIGLEPDIMIKMTEEDYLNENDPQLNKAIELLKNL